MKKLTFSVLYSILRQLYFSLRMDIFTWKTRVFAWKALLPPPLRFRLKWMKKKGGFAAIQGRAIGKRECARYRQFISAVQAELISVTTARGQSEWATVTRWDFWSHRAPTKRNVSAFFFIQFSIFLPSNTDQFSYSIGFQRSRLLHLIVLHCCCCCCARPVNKK